MATSHVLRVRSAILALAVIGAVGASVVGTLKLDADERVTSQLNEESRYDIRVGHAKRGCGEQWFSRGAFELHGISDCWGLGVPGPGDVFIAVVRDEENPEHGGFLFSGTAQIDSPVLRDYTPLLTERPEGRPKPVAFGGAEDPWKVCYRTEVGSLEGFDILRGRYTSDEVSRKCPAGPHMVPGEASKTRCDLAMSEPDLEEPERTQGWLQLIQGYDVRGPCWIVSVDGYDRGGIAIGAGRFNEEQPVLVTVGSRLDTYWGPSNLPRGMGMPMITSVGGRDIPGLVCLRFPEGTVWATDLGWDSPSQGQMREACGFEFQEPWAPNKP